MPEFQEFVDRNNPTGAAKDFFGAQLMGSWKSGILVFSTVVRSCSDENVGTPLVLAPKADTDPTLGKDPLRNNNFDYDPSSQSLCPYAAHSRKTNPRGDIQQSVASKRIVRRAITFGEELTAEEIESKKTILDRGLLFKCYQSNIAEGFQFIQECIICSTQYLGIYTLTCIHSLGE